MSFDFWASKLEPHINTAKMLIEAFATILTEVSAGVDMSIDDFVREYGYDTRTTKISDIIEIYEVVHDNSIKIDYIVDGDWDAVNFTIEELEKEGYL